MQKNLFTIKLLSVTFVLIFSFHSLQAQLEVTGGQAPQELIENFLGVGVTVTNVVINCPEVAYGTFDGTNSNIGIDNGILLTTGSISNAVGPNNSDAAQVDNGGDGDADLAAIVDRVTLDACVLEFDFVPSSDKLTFKYVFASEEYLEWVNNSYNDVFAFFITGTNPNGGTYEKQNIALIPGTDTPVSINTLNDSENSEFFIDNGSGTFPIDPTTTIQYDGFTLPLFVEAEVVPCEIYHLKIAIADVEDAVIDSGVFLEAGSLNTDVVSVTASTSIATDTAVEGCLEGTFTFTSSTVLAEELVIDLEISGSAENGVDYTSIPAIVVIPAGETTANIEIEGIDDGVLEGIENITIRFDSSLGCEGTEQTEAMLFLSDASDAGSVSANPTMVCEGGTITATSNGAVIADGNSAIFVVHNSPDGDVNMDGFTIFSMSSTGDFLNDGGIPQGISLYISVAVGGDDGVLNDVCLKVSPPVEVAFLAPITFLIDEYCDPETGDYYVSLQLEGGLPELDNTVTYSITGDYAGTYSFGEEAIIVIYADGIDNRYDFNVTDGFGCTGSVLSDIFECAKNPIDLLSFEGEVLVAGNRLQWVTATELDNDYFQLSRSTDGKNYEEVATIKSQGESQNFQSYEFLDRNAPAGLTYYQLTQYDFNGLSTTFPVLSLQRGETTDLELIQVYPVPAKDVLGISFMAAKDELVQISLYNVMGQVVLSQSIQTTASGMNTVSLETQMLSSGVYLLSVSSQNGQVSQRIVKE